MLIFLSLIVVHVLMGKKVQSY